MERERECDTLTEILIPSYNGDNPVVKCLASPCLSIPMDTSRL